MRTVAPRAIEPTEPIYDAEPIYDTFGAAIRLGVHYKTVQRWTREGKLLCSQLGPRTRRYSEAQIRQFLSLMTVVPKSRKRGKAA